VQLQQQRRTWEGFGTGPYEGSAVFFIRNGSSKNRSLRKIEEKLVENAEFIGAPLQGLPPSFRGPRLTREKKTKRRLSTVIDSQRANLNNVDQGCQDVLGIFLEIVIHWSFVIGHWRRKWNGLPFVSQRPGFEAQPRSPGEDRREVGRE